MLFLTFSKKRKLASFNSTKLLQETILDIVEFYSNFDRFYFPVRLNQRGRVYCTLNYFNDQSNELSKALLQFADPGIILKTDISSINQLIAYGANCYGGKTSKQSLVKKNKFPVVALKHNTRYIRRYVYDGITKLFICSK